ncbi:hypothetical protein DYI25_15015 [Mesobacillus boroniphilus]|uniref:Uncharacterized protein n=1 Tax=Mesobacillus boroniphilus TaxID=308892 RepID=A0A944GYF9_9BACI|nr:hypothetical protein [Mesobacillus boroniphilus]
MAALSIEKTKGVDDAERFIEEDEREFPNLRERISAIIVKGLKTIKVDTQSLAAYCCWQAFFKSQ